MYIFHYMGKGKQLEAEGSHLEVAADEELARHFELLDMKVVVVKRRSRFDGFTLPRSTLSRYQLMKEIYKILM